MPSQWVSTDDGTHLRGRRKEHTEPEMLLRSALHVLGARFRLHRRIAPCCTPDLVLPRRRIAVFVDGDYWHSCPEHGRKIPFAGPTRTYGLRSCAGTKNATLSRLNWLRRRAGPSSTCGNVPSARTPWELPGLSLTAECLVLRVTASLRRLARNREATRGAPIRGRRRRTPARALSPGYSKLPKPGPPGYR